VEEDEVAQDVAVDGLLEGIAAAFEALEEVGSEKPIKRFPARERSSSCFASEGVGGWWGAGAT
jgi:hypothetical protein